MRSFFGFLVLSLITAKSFASFEVVGDISQTFQVDLASQLAPSITLTLKNIGSSIDSVSSLITGSDKFSISLNRCSNISPGKSCQISITPKRGLVIGDYSFSVANATRTLSILDSRLGEGQQPESVIVASPASFSLDFTDGSRSKVISLSLKNNSKVPANLSFSWAPADSLGAVLVLNRCSSQLGAYKSCVISYRINLPVAGTNVTQSLVVNDGAVQKASVDLTVYRPGSSGPVQPPMVNLIISPFTLVYSSSSYFIDFISSTYPSNISLGGYVQAVKMFNRVFIIQQYQDVYIESPPLEKYFITHFDSSGSEIIGGNLNQMFTVSNYGQFLGKVEFSARGSKIEEINSANERLEVAHTQSGKLFTLGRLVENGISAVRLYSENGDVTTHSLPTDDCIPFEINSKDYGSYDSSFFKHRNGKISFSMYCNGSYYVGIVRDEGIQFHSFNSIKAFDFSIDENSVWVAEGDGSGNVSAYEINISSGVKTQKFSYKENPISFFSWQVVSDGIYVLGSSDLNLKTTAVTKFSLSGSSETVIFDSGPSFEIDAPNGLSALFLEGSSNSISLVHSSMYNGGTTAFIRKRVGNPAEIFPIDLNDQNVDYNLAFLFSMKILPNYTILTVHDAAGIGLGDTSGPSHFIYFDKVNGLLQDLSIENEKQIRGFRFLNLINEGDDAFLSYKHRSNPAAGGFIKINLSGSSVEDYPASAQSEYELVSLMFVKNGVGYFSTKKELNYNYAGVQTVPFATLEINSINLNALAPSTSVQLSTVNSQLNGSQTIALTQFESFETIVDNNFYLPIFFYNLQVDFQPPSNQTELKMKLYKLE